MSEQERLHKLEKVVAFYRSQLRIRRAELSRIQLVVLQIQATIRGIDTERKATEQQFVVAEPTISNRLMAGHKLEQIQHNWLAAQSELQASQNELEAARTRVVDQMSRIESLERLLERKARLMEYEQQRRRQTSADQRFLNTKFTESKQ